MSPIEQDLSQIVESVWATVLGLDIRSVTPLPKSKHRSLTGCVHISGAWQGSLILNCTSELASVVAGTMFDIEAANASADEVRDALGELTNIIAGNVKAVLPSPSYLSQPAVADGQDYSLRVPHSELVHSLSFLCDEEPVEVALLAAIPHDGPLGR